MTGHNPSEGDIVERLRYFISVTDSRPHHEPGSTLHHALVEAADRLSVMEEALRYADLFAELWEQEPNGPVTIRAAIAFRAKRNGSIAFDTPLAKELIAFLRANGDNR